ncbi:g2246 [Coccomyxa viridis]|uniref:NF-kappa-B inhibitor-like protein 1 n=1 Tax=Coccomyxa viridis TaxID=1274662 RepID=A0ABP1FJY2_9CHLO
MSLFHGCFFPRKATKGSATKKQTAYDRGILEDRWKQYDNLSKESTWGQAAAPGVIHITSKAQEEVKESPMRRTFSKHGLEETWDFYQETQGPKTLESMPEAEQKSFLALLAAAADGNVTKLTELLKQPHYAKHINSTDEEQRTALILAIEGNHVEALPLLIAAGADVNHTVDEEDSPLHLAIRYSQNSAAILLAQQSGITINAKNEDGWTPLHEACCLGLADVVEALLKHGADAQARCTDGTTPLHKAARAGNKAAVAMLIKAGADVSAVDKNGLEPLDVALDEAIADLLQGWGNDSPKADVDAGQARKEYEKRWQDFSSSTAGDAGLKQKLAYIDIPWPLDEFASNGQLVSVVFAGTLGQVEWRRRLRTELLRWHPDKFQARFGAALLEADRERVMQRVQAICEVLNAAQPLS